MMNPNSITTSIRPNAYLSSTGNTGSVGQQTNAPFNPGNNQALLQQLMQLIQQLVAQQNQGQGQQPPNRPIQNGHHQGQGQQPPNRPINGYPNQPPRPNTQPGNGHPYPPNISPKPNTPPGNGGGTPAPTLNLSTTQQSSVKQLMGYDANAPFTVTVNDTNRDGKLSGGDVAILKGGITGGEIARKQLTDVDAYTIWTSRDSNVPTVNLGSKQSEAIKQLMGATDNSLGVMVYDNDNNRILSAGDDATLTRLTNTGVQEVARQRLTAADMNSINNSLGTSTGLATLQTNQAKWDAYQNGNYDYTAAFSGYFSDMGRPVNINVRNDQVTNAIYADNGTATPSYRRVTIDDIFGQVRDAYNAGADQVNVTYDPTSGAPTSVQIDPNLWASDDQYGYTLSNIQKR